MISLGFSPGASVNTYFFKSTTFCWIRTTKRIGVVIKRSAQEKKETKRMLIGSAVKKRKRREIKPKFFVVRLFSFARALVSTQARNFFGPVSFLNSR